MIKKDTADYREFLLKADYYKQLLVTIEGLSAEEITKDSKLVYEILYSRNSLKELLGNPDIEDIVKPLYEGFNVCAESIKNSSKKDGTADKRKHKNIDKAKYLGSEYDGKYEVEKVIEVSALSISNIAKWVAPKIVAIAVLIWFIIATKQGLVIRLASAIMRLLE